MDPLCNLQSHVHYSWSRLSRLWNFSHFVCICHEILISNNWKKPGQAFSNYTYKNRCAKNIMEKYVFGTKQTPSSLRTLCSRLLRTCMECMLFTQTQMSQTTLTTLVSVAGHELALSFCSNSSKLQTAHSAATHRGKRPPLRSITSCSRSGKWRTRSCTWNCELMCCAHAAKLRES